MTVVYPPNTALGRFGIVDLVDSADQVVASMPLTGWVNPLTGIPTAGPLAVLVDHVGGLVNHSRREADKWTVSSELSLELTPSTLTVIADNPESVAVATARPVGTTGSTAVGMCEIAVGEAVVGVGTVRSFYVTHPGEFPQVWPPHVDAPRLTELAEIMGLRIDANTSSVIYQRQNSALNNSLGVMHGGVAAAGLELAASGALNAGRSEQPLHTASVRVNFLRQFFSGGQSRYTATALRIGRRSGVAEAQAIGADAEVALVARVTAYL